MDIRSVKGLRSLHGDNRVCLAVLDGPVDLSHPCFQGADLKKLDTLAQNAAGPKTDVAPRDPGSRQSLVSAGQE